MKKLLFSLATIVALSLATVSCGSSKEEGANVDELTTSLEEALNAANDSSAIIDAFSSAQKTISELEAAGDTAAVNAYKWKLKQLYDQNKDKFESMNVVSALNEVANIEEIAKSVKAAAVADAETAKEDAIEAAKAAVESNEAVQDAKAKAEEVKAKAEEVKATAEEVKKSAEEVKAAAENAKEALSKLKKN